MLFSLFLINCSSDSELDYDKLMKKYNKHTSK